MSQEIPALLNSDLISRYHEFRRMKPRNSICPMEIDLLDFVEQCRHLAKQALGKHAGEPASGGFARWVHVVLHCFRLEEGHSYRETPNRLKYLTEIRDALGLDRDDLPDYSTIYKSFDRLKMWVWRALLRVSAQQHPQSGHAALDSTFFDRRSCFVVLPPTVGKHRADAESDDINRWRVARCS